MALSFVRLDTTVADLYREHGIHGPFLASTHPVFTFIEFHPEFPRETIYPADTESFAYVDEQDIARFREIFLGLKPCKRAFGLGKMDVILFNHSTEHTKRVLDQLPYDQRPNPCFIDLDKGNVSDQLRQFSKEKKLLYWNPQGWMSEHDCLIDLKLADEIGSKKYLITSGIRTPKSEIVELPVGNVQKSFLANKALPFVVKLIRSSAGCGTWLVTTEARRKTMLSAMSNFKTRGGRDIMLSDYINIKHSFCIHLVIGAMTDGRNRDNPRIIAVTEQTFNAENHWTGGMINYSAQTTLKQVVRDTVCQTTRLLPESFVGWAGLDIVVDDDGRQWVVDLNPRWTGSVPMCLLSDHFYKQRGFSHAQFTAFTYLGATEDVYTLLESNIRSGQVVVNAVANVGGETNMVDLAWGGKSEEDLHEMMETIKRKIGRKSD